MIPKHLPERLAICYYGWDWITSATPGEAYYDMDLVMRQTRERGFNCVRPEMGLGLLYDGRGSRRGPIKFRARFAGANSNMQCVNAKGGGVFDLHERVMRLFELAEKYDLYVIGTSWLYQDFLTEVDDPALREEIAAVPGNKRLMMFARQWDWLLRDLKERNLLHRLAMAELLNEVDGSVISSADDSPGKLTFQDWLEGRPQRAMEETIRGMTGEALAFIQSRHGEVLTTVDFCGSGAFPTWCPENAQVADHHVYHGAQGVTLEIMKAAGINDSWGGQLDFEKGPKVEGNAVLAEVFKKDLTSWEEICRYGRDTRKGWYLFAWFYQNIDNARYDDWCARHFEPLRRGILETARNAFRRAAVFAHPRNLPLVVDEGYILFPPLGSRFVCTPDGRWGEEIAVEAAIETGHWGIIPTAYFRPNTPVWFDDDQCDWISRLNRRIMQSK